MSLPARALLLFFVLRIRNPGPSSMLVGANELSFHGSAAGACLSLGFRLMEGRNPCGLFPSPPSSEFELLGEGEGSIFALPEIGGCFFVRGSYGKNDEAPRL